MDYVVDGGYFENDGLTSARQLAEAVHRVQPKLLPVILHITNNPTSESVGLRDVNPRSARTQEWYDALIAPFSALYETRDGHAAEAAEAVRAASDWSGGPIRTVVSFKVDDGVSASSGKVCRLGSTEPSDPAPPKSRIKDLSMSWWLSGAVQSYLDHQLCSHDNIQSYKQLVDAMARRVE